MIIVSLPQVPSPQLAARNGFGKGTALAVPLRAEENTGFSPLGCFLRPLNRLLKPILWTKMDLPSSWYSIAPVPALQQLLRG